MSAARQSSLTIETPEGVVWAFDLATPVTRALAWAVDAAGIAAITYAARKFSEGLGMWSPDWANALSMAVYLAVSMGYAILLEWRWRGQTIGKRLLRLRVIDAHGLQLRFAQIVLRDLIRAVDMLPLTYLIGGASALLTRDGQRLGDLAANTIVIREREHDEPNLAQIEAARYNSLLAYPTSAARLRSIADPEAVSIALRAIAGRDGFAPLARVEVFRELGEYFRELAPFPNSALEGLTDEQYVRSVVGAIYNPAGR